MKIEKLHRNTWNKSGTKYREEMIFDKLEEIIDQLEKQEQSNKTFSERLGLDPDDDRSKPDEECECGGRVTLEKVCEHCGIFYHPMGESKLKLQRLLEWVERYSVYKNKRWLCPDNIMIKDLTDKIKELMDEE